MFYKVIMKQTGKMCIISPDLLFLSAHTDSDTGDILQNIPKNYI